MTIALYASNAPRSCELALRSYLIRAGERPFWQVVKGHCDLGIRAPWIFIEGEVRLQHFKRQSLLCIRRANVESKTPQGRATSFEQHAPREQTSLISRFFLTGMSLHVDLLFRKDYVASSGSVPRHASGPSYVVFQTRCTRYLGDSRPTYIAYYR